MLQLLNPENVILEDRYTTSIQSRKEEETRQSYSNSSISDDEQSTQPIIIEGYGLIKHISSYLSLEDLDSITRFYEKVPNAIPSDDDSDDGIEEYYKQKDLRDAIFSHEGSIRSYFKENVIILKEDVTKELVVTKSFLRNIVFRNIPLSILFQLLESVLEVTVNTSISIYKITEQSLFYFVEILTRLLQRIWDNLKGFFHPCEIVPFILSFSKKDIKSTSCSLIISPENISTCSNHSNDKYKLQKRLEMDISTSRVISYIEREEEMMNEQAKMRVQRMMHYNVSLRPFVATVLLNDTKQEPSLRTLTNTMKPSSSTHTNMSKESSSPFMQTPASFPPSPSSRSLVMDRSTRFAEDVLFLARTQLRNEENRCSNDARTRAMANALHDGCRFAIWNAMDTNSSVLLNCGQHVATKVSASVLYGSSRSMVPLLRNCFVYFEISILSNTNIGMASLCLGLSTLEMPLNTLVGAWKSSIGYCTTGQILISGQWCSSSCSANGISTIGCLAYIDDDSAFETWDGIIVNASITFNVNRSVIIPAFATPTLRILLPRDEELYPTITLHSLGTQVKCHFCNDDVLPIGDCSDIGAPVNTPVYCLDGSLLTFSNVVEDEDSELDDDSYFDSLKPCSL